MTPPTYVSEWPAVVSADSERGRGDARDRVAVRVDDQRVRVDGHQRVQGRHVRGVLQDPALVGVVEPDELEVLLVPGVGVGPVLRLQPLRVAGEVGERLVGVRLPGLAQQPPALLHGGRIHVVDAHEVRALVVVCRERLLHGVEDRVLLPRLPWRPRLRVLRQPHLQALGGGVGVQVAVQRGGAGAGQAHQEDRSLDRHVAVLGVRGELRLREQYADQRALHLRALEVVAARRQPRLGRGQVLDQDPQPFLVRGAAEVGHPGGAHARRRRCPRRTRRPGARGP